MTAAAGGSLTILLALAFLRLLAFLLLLNCIIEIRGQQAKQFIYAFDALKGRALKSHIINDFDSLFQNRNKGSIIISVKALSKFSVIQNLIKKDVEILFFCCDVFFNSECILDELQIHRSNVGPAIPRAHLSDFPFDISVFNAVIYLAGQITEYIAESTIFHIFAQEDSITGCDSLRRVREPNAFSQLLLPSS
ncbi:hypothetical protein B5F36_10000 [Anaerofilum sp. An201]|nr:hypothetical protein B5F36_10000 [Anaerofilum sp. An201]